MKRKILLTLGLLFSVVTMLGVLAACGGLLQKGKDKKPGAEAGEYYCDYQDAEYSLTLGDGEACTFNLKIGTTELKGDYELENDALTLTPENAGAISATYKNDRVTLTYSDVTYTFLRKIDYTVTFDTNGGTTIDAVTVRNGRTVAKPAAPTKGELVFVGWYTDNTFKNPFYFSQPITGDKTLYARFVALADPEFTVSFDLGYEGAVNPADVKTVNHRIYVGTQDTPVHPEGKEFLGWYVSDFEDEDELTYEYTEDLEITQNLTLFAVWADGAPEVSVSAAGVKINAEGTNLSYSLRITPPAPAAQATNTGALTTGAATVDTSFNFATAAAGKYKIEVDVNNKTTTRYFNNKALARVSVFDALVDAEDILLVFNKVANATTYTLSYSCGTAAHDAHAVTIAATEATGEYLTYNLTAAGCDMLPDGITFTVEASADGYVSSESEEYLYKNVLDKIENSQIELDKATGIISWPEVEHATAYRVNITLDGTAVVEDEDVTVCSYSVTNFGVGEFTITIVPRAFGWNSPEAAEYTYTKQALAAPQNVHIEGSVVTWDTVPGATGYEVHVGDKVVPVTGGTTTTYSMTEEDLPVGNSAEVTVYAVGGETDSKSYSSDGVNVTNSDVISGLTYSAKELTWDAVFAATGYEWKIGENGTVKTVTTHKASVTFTAKGTQTLYVRAVKTGRTCDWAHVDVAVYQIGFDITTQGLDTSSVEEIPDMFLAEGDPITLPEPEGPVGYDFGGWFRDSHTGTAQYDSTTFDGGDLTLFVKWDPKKFIINLEVGTEGTCPETVEVYYQQAEVELPIPTPASVEYTFQGWYLGAGGTGRLYANATDGKAGAYTRLSGLTVYARWSTPFAYKKSGSGANTKYTVSAGAYIVGEKEVTIPDKHEGYPVVTVGDFNMGSALEVINIPNTVETITLGTVGSAFESLNNLKAVNIYPVEGNNNPKYASKNGIVYEVEGNRLVYVPKAYRTETNSTEVTLPDNIEVIVSGAMYKNRTITKLTIPASVKEVQTNAIYGNNSLKTNANGDKLEEIVFEPAAENGELTIANEAFINLHTLASITLPKYVKAVDAEQHEVVFGAGQIKNCVSLENINIAEGHPGDAYFSEDGVLCRTADNVREIVYYPVARAATTYTFPTAAGITVIAAHAFEKATNLQSITIPATITKIGEAAFNDCSGITSIVFQSGAEDEDLTIEKEAFADTKPVSLTIPANVTKVEWHAFYCYTLKNVTLEGKAGMQVDYADRGVFYTTTEKLTIKENFPVIDIASVFASQSETAKDPTKAKLTDIDVSGNSNYKKVTEGAGAGAIFDKDMTKILYILTETADFTVPDGITEIGSSLFVTNKTLQTITIPASVKTIADSAFKGCENLTTVTFTAKSGEGKRDDLTVGKRAFNACKKLTAITLPAETKSIGAGAFAECLSLTTFTVPGGVAVVDEELFSGSGIETITLSEGVETIKAGALENCKSLTNISLPKTLTTIAEEIFFGCTSLTEINVAEGSEHFASKDGVLYIAQKRAKGTEIDPITLYYVPISGQADNGALNVPETVTSVAARALQNNTGITSVNFAEEVVAYNDDGTKVQGKLVINDYAFFGNSTGNVKIASIKLPVGLTEIGKQAFSYLHYLTEIEIPYTVTKIGEQAFYMSDRLATVTFADTPAEPAKAAATDATTEETTETKGVELTLAKNAFYGVTGLKTVVLPERPKVTLDVATFSGCYNLESITLPSKLDGLPGPTSGQVGMFTNFKKLTTVNFSETVPANFVIGNYTFSGCINLEHVGTAKQVTVDDQGTKEDVYFLPEGVKTIGAYAFNGSGITSIGIPKSVSELGVSSYYYRQFQECAKLETIAFADDCALTYLPAGLMTGARSLKHVVFGAKSHIEIIGVYAKELGGSNSDTIAGGVFAGAVHLESLTIPASVEIIENGCFTNLVNLNDVKFEEGSKLQSIGGALLTSNTEEKGTDPVFAFTGLTSFTFPKITNEKGEVQAINVAPGIFNGCSNLTSITLSESVTEINNLFKGVSSLETVTVPEGSTLFEVDAANKAVYSLNAEGEKDVLLCIYGDVESVLNIAAGTKEIAANLYKGRTTITQVNIPASVVTIGESAFENCLNLTKVAITVGTGEASALSLIGNAAFKNCWALNDFEFAKAANLNRIGDEAFYACAFTKLDLRQNHQLGNNASGTTENGIGESAFENNKLLGTEIIDTSVAQPDQYSVMLPNELKTLEARALYATQITRIDLSNTKLTTVAGGGSSEPGNGIFAKTPLAEIKLPTTVTKITERAFGGLSALKKINLTDLTKLTTIGHNAFNGVGLETIVLPSSVTTLSGAGTFRSNPSLTTIDLSKTKVTTLGSGSMFREDTALQTVKLPKGITELPDNAFDGCSALTTVTYDGCEATTGVNIPDKVKKIGKGVFNGCTNVTEVVFPTALETLGNASNSASDVGAFVGTSLQKADFSKTGLKNIGANVFKDVSALTEVTFSDALIFIGNYAFQGTGITSVHLPESMATVSVRAFQGCTDLAEVTYEKDGIALGANCFQDTALTSFDFEKLGTVGNYAFQGTNFTSFTFPEYNITWGTYAFYKCESLQEVTVPSYVTAIPANMFQDCTALGKVTIESEYLTSIGGSAFSGCTALDEIEWPTALDSLTTLGTYVFQKTGFTELSLANLTNDKMTKLPTGTFDGCEHLETVTLGPQMTSLGQYAFRNCTALTTVNGMTQITTFDSTCQFQGCTALETIDVSNVTTFGNFPFDGCEGLNNVTINAEKIPQYAFRDCKALTTITMPNVTTIDRFAFQGTTFTTFEIPATVTTINVTAFSLCEDLTAFTVADGNEAFAVGANGALYQLGEGGAKILIAYPAAAETVALDEDATEIATLAFSGVNKAEATLTIPGNVTIDGAAFLNCTLAKVIVEDGTGSIMQYAFAENKSSYPDAHCGVKEVEFAGSTALNASAALTTTQYLFQNNQGTTKVTLPDGLTTIGSYWFAGTSKTSSADAIPTAITTVVIPASVTTIKDSAFKDASLTDIVIPETVTTIEQNAFANNTSLTHLTFNAAVSQATIAASVFSGCTSLEDVKFGPKVTTIGEKMFEGCTSLAHFIAVGADAQETQDALPGLVDYIGAVAFKGTAIESLTLPDNTENPLTIVSGGSNGTFEGCVNLKNMVLPEGTTVVGYRMFYGCTALEWVKLPNTITTIKMSAFDQCENLKFVNMSEDITDWGSAFSGTPNLHVFIPKGCAKFNSTNIWKDEGEARCMYFEDSEYAVLSSRGLWWHVKTDHSDFKCGATLAQALKDSGATDFPGYDEIVGQD